MCSGGHEFKLNSSTINKAEQASNLNNIRLKLDCASVISVCRYRKQTKLTDEPLKE